MPNFSNIERLNLEGTETVPFELDVFGLDETITLYLRPATQANKELLAAQTKLAAKRERQARRGRDDANLDETMDETFRQFAEYVIVGWEEVYDADGNEVDFNSEVCLEFLHALPVDYFLEVARFAADSKNFVNIEDGADLGKP